MTADVERVARALAYLDNGADGAWKHYVDVAIVAMRVTREIDADALRAEALQQEIAGRRADAQGMEAAPDWLQQRANDVRGGGNG
jgi:hypothetical protein